VAEVAAAAPAAIATILTALIFGSYIVELVVLARTPRGTLQPKEG